MRLGVSLPIQTPLFMSEAYTWPLCGWAPQVIGRFARYPLGDPVQIEAAHAALRISNIQLNIVRRRRGGQGGVPTDR